MSEIAPGPGVADKIVAMDQAGVDRADIVASLVAVGLAPSQASQLVVEVLDAEDLGRLARSTPPAERGPIARFSRSALRFVLSAIAVLAASSLVAWIAAFLPTIFGWIGLYGIGLVFGRLLATLAGIAFALTGVVMAADSRDAPLLAGVSAGAILFYVFVLSQNGF